MADAVVLTDVHAGYGTVPVLHAVNLRVAAGEVVALLGRPGAARALRAFGLALAGALVALLLALAFIFVIYDGMKSIADKGLVFTKIGQFWIDIHTSSMQLFQAAVERYTSADFWRIVAQPVLDQPAAAYQHLIDALGSQPDATTEARARQALQDIATRQPRAPGDWPQ